jgi:hypothetical protein
MEADGNFDRSDEFGEPTVFESDETELSIGPAANWEFAIQQ